MKITRRTSRVREWSFGAALLAVFAIAGCTPGQRASEMTSYSAQGAKSETPELFTIPQDQMSHVQVVTVQTTRLTRTLRLTGAVAYNAFKTTPVISQVGGPVTPDSDRAGPARERRPADARSHQPGLLAIARHLSEGGRFVPPRRQKLRPGEGFVRASRDCRARSAASGIRPHTSASRPECRRAGHENPGHQESRKISRTQRAFVGANSGARADKRRSGGAARLAGAGDSGGPNAGVHHFRHEHRVGAGQCVPDRSWRTCTRATTSW